MRLNKFIAASGITSRRKADQLIAAGEISLNGKVITELGTEVFENDIVTYKGQIINEEKSKIYLMLNKPPKYLSSVSDDRDRKTVIDLVKNTYSERLYPVGRLDYETEGLLILTNDGDITNKLTHPKHHIKKTYLVKTDKPITKEIVSNLENGVLIDDYMTKKAELKLDIKHNNQCEITIGEGRNRQVRKMFASQGLEVVYLKRLSMGDLKLGSLEIGKTRELTQKEISYLKSIN